MSQSRSRIAPKLHVILYLQGERDGAQTIQTARTQLLHRLSDLLARLGATQNLHAVSILLGPGTILLEDVAALRPELVLAVAANAVIQRFRVNPWYAQPEPTLAGGEALVRDLILARSDTEAHRLALSQVVTLPQVMQFPAQLPQILAGFRIPAVLLPPGSESLGLPFRWEAPDGSSVLVLSQEQEIDPAEAIESQRHAQPDGPFLWMHSTIDDIPPIELLEEDLALPVKYSNLEAYVEAVRSSFPDELRPLLQGSLHTRLAQDGAYAAVRVAFKQELTRLREVLLHLAEPLLALALTHSKLPYPQNEQALLQQSWRWLLQNQTKSIFSGAITDPAQADAEQRNRHIAEYADLLLERALAVLPGNPVSGGTLPDAAETYIAIWNGLGQRVTQEVHVPIKLPANRYPAALLAPNKDDVPFTWNSSTQAISFRAVAPSVGYSTYTLKLTRTQDMEALFNPPQVGHFISREGESLSLEDGTLSWISDQHTMPNLLRYEDGGDAGEVCHYQQPRPDVIVPGSVVGKIEVESFSWVERLRFQHRLRIAPKLQEGTSRNRGVRVLDIQTTASLYQDSPGLHLHIAFENSAQDHRLRAYLRTGISPTALYTDDLYGLRQIPISPEKMPGAILVPGVLALYGQNRGVALCSKVPFQVEPILEDGQVTLVLTLLRAVGWIDQSTQLTASSAQEPGTHALDFLLLPLLSQHQPTKVLQAANAYRTPLHGVQYEQPLDYEQFSYLQAQEAMLISVKPPQRMPGLVARLLNPTDEEKQVILLHAGLVRQAQILNLAEEPLAACPVVGNRVLLTMRPHQILTVWLEVL